MRRSRLRAMGATKARRIGDMGFLIGTDEAGYGPNLGPLVVSATIWQIPDRLCDADLYGPLSRVVTAEPMENGQALPIVIADSKQLYRPGGSLAELERGVLALLQVTGHAISTWRDLWSVLDADSLQSLDDLPWYAEFDHAIPCDCRPDTIVQAAAGLRDDASPIRCLGVRSSALFPRQLNEFIDRHGNKATVLSTVTLSLVRALFDDLPDSEPITIRCDKHGGRNKYAALLQHFFPEHFIRVERESRVESHYSWRSNKRQVEVRFSAKGEKHLACAAASMTSKYVRELAMRAFNRFWCQKIPRLKPTAGYPVDARRFRDEIRTKQLELQIQDESLWRKR